MRVCMRSAKQYGIDSTKKYEIDFKVKWQDESLKDTWEGFKLFSYDAPEHIQKYFGILFKEYSIPLEVDNISKIIKQRL